MTAEQKDKAKAAKDAAKAKVAAAKADHSKKLDAPLPKNEQPAVDAAAKAQGGQAATAAAKPAKNEAKTFRPGEGDRWAALEARVTELEKAVAQIGGSVRVDGKALDGTHVGSVAGLGRIGE